MTRDRNQLSALIKQWAQSHSANWQIDNPDLTDQGMQSASHALDWVLKQGYANLDLLSLLNILEKFLQNKKNQGATDGMFCKNCKQFISFAEPNQPDGSLICYTCRQNPYI